jgi:hypothetical protein
MVQPSYMLHKPVPRSYAKIVFDQQIVPALINAAGGVEALLERLALSTKSSPARYLAASWIAGFALGCLVARKTPWHRPR